MGDLICLAERRMMVAMALASRPAAGGGSAAPALSPDPLFQLVLALDARLQSAEARILELERRGSATVAVAAPAVAPVAAAVPAPQTTAERRAQEKARIVVTLTECGWNRQKAAQRMGMARRTFYRRLAEYGIQ